MSNIIRLVGSATAVWGGRWPELWAHQQLEGWGPRPDSCCCPVTCGYMCTGVMCTASPAATGFSEAVSSAAVVRRLGLEVPPLLFARFCLLYSTPLTFR